MLASSPHGYHWQLVSITNGLLIEIFGLEVKSPALFRYRPEVLVLNFSEVHFMDSSGIGLIIGRSEVASAVGAKVKLEGLSERLLRLVRLSGLEKISGLLVQR